MSHSGESYAYVKLPVEVVSSTQEDVGFLCRYVFSVPGRAFRDRLLLHMLIYCNGVEVLEANAEVSRQVLTKVVLFNLTSLLSLMQPPVTVNHPNCLSQR